MKRNSCNISEEDRAHAIEMHTALHEGLAPKELICETWINEPVTHILGTATEIQYKKKVPDEFPSYHHPWAEQARPTIGITKDGHLRIFAGRYETTRRGIEDRVSRGMTTVKYLKQPHVQREYLPSNPTGLITLGKLEWIKYDSDSRNSDSRNSDSRNSGSNSDGNTSSNSNGNTSSNSVSNTSSNPSETKLLKFNQSNAPVIAHDQNGDLHILGGQYLITKSGVEKTMAHARKSSRSRRSGRSSGMMFGGFDNPRKSHRASHRRSRSSGFLSIFGHGRKGKSRRNPVESIVGAGNSGYERAGRMILSTAIMGGVAVVSAYGLDYAIASFIPAYSPQAKAGIKIGTGLVGGLLLAAVLPQSLASIPAGFAVGGVFEGLRDFFNIYIAPSIPQPGAVLVPAVTPPAAQALMPGGVPQAYQQYSPQACGVRY